MNVTAHLATFRRTAGCDADGRPRRAEISTCLGLLPEHFTEFMGSGTFHTSRSLSRKVWKRIGDFAEFNRAECVTSPFGVLGHDLVALHLISSPKTDEEQAFQQCRVFATASAPKLRREKSASGPELICIDVRLDYAGMMHTDLWPQHLRAPGDGRIHNPL